MQTPTPIAPGLQRSARYLSRASAVLGILAILAVALPGPAYRLAFLGLSAAFIWVRMGAGGGILAIVLSLLGLALLLRARTRLPSYGWAVLGLILGVLAFGIPYSEWKRMESAPPIHDITTDTLNPPQFHAILPLRAQAPNSPMYGGPAVAARQLAAYPDIRPLFFSLPPVRVYDAALQAAQVLHWHIVAQNASLGTIEATDTTFWFGFKDDIVIRVAGNAAGTRLDIRSESRVSVNDAGGNAARIRTFRARLERLLGQKPQ